MNCIRLKKAIAAAVTGILICTIFLPAIADTRIMAVSDLHLMAPELYEGSSLLERSLESGDGKVSFLSRELADGLVAEVLHQQPDALVVTGDLSMAGEYRSHLFVAQTLQRIADAGIPVCVIPGNHDINAWIAYDYSGEKLAGTHTIDDDVEFQKIYSALLPGKTAPDGLGVSYVYRVNDQVWLLMLDTCYYEDSQAVGGYLREGMLDWIRQVLEDASAVKAQVICSTHQSLTAHSSLFSDRYSVYGGEDLEKLLASYGMKLNLSGHVHAQHLIENNGIWDAAVGGYCISPHLYAMITVGEDGSIVYEAKETCSSHFPDAFTERTRTFFLDAARKKVTGEEELPDELAEAAVSIKCRMNYAYFSGTMGNFAKELSEDSTWQQLLASSGDAEIVRDILDTMMETSVNMRFLSIP